MNGVQTLEKIDSVKRVCFSLHNRTALHIGAGGAPISPVEPDNAVMKLGDKVFIPGSSLKGIFRSTLESIDKEACTGLIDENWCLEENGDLKKKEASARQKMAIARIEAGRLCPVCRLFGNPYTQGRLFFNDAIATQTDHKSLQKRDGVRIQRETETAVNGGKFDFETVVPGHEFPVEIVGMNLEQQDIDKLKLVINLINLGVVKIGGMTSRGLGRFEVKDLKVEEVKLDV